MGFSSCLRADLILIRRGHLRALFALPFVVAVALGIDAPCRAGLVIEAPNLTVAPGSSGSFDVLITSTGGHIRRGVRRRRAFPQRPERRFLHGCFDRDGDALYLRRELGNDPRVHIYFSTFPGTQFETVDFLYQFGAQTINAGDVFGLVNVQYSVAANATPGASGSLTFGPDTSLADADGNNVPFTAPNGSITISSVSRAVECDAAGSEYNRPDLPWKATGDQTLRIGSVPSLTSAKATFASRRAELASQETGSWLEGSLLIRPSRIGASGTGSPCACFRFAVAT